LVLAPAVSAAFRSPLPPATRLSELSLNNLGATMATLLGWDLHGEPSQVVLFSVGLYALVVALTAGLSLMTSRLVRRIQWRATGRLQLMLLRQVLAQPMSFFRSQRTGQLATRIVSDTTTAATMVEAALKGVWESGLQLLLFGILLLRTDLALGLTVGAAVMIHVVVSRALDSRLRAAARAKSDVPAKVGGHVHEVLGGARVVKSFGAEAYEHSRLSGLIAANRDLTLKATLPADSEGPLRDVVNAFAGGIAVIVAFAALATGRLTFSGFVLFVFAARQTIVPFSRLATAIGHFVAGAEAARRVFALMEAGPPARDGNREAPPLRHAVELKDVWFAYEGRDPVLKGVSLTIPRGARVALVGPSGAGKSTLVDLLLHLEEPTRGVITYDGIDVSEMRQDSYRRRFGVVSQEIVLFHTSVAENIAYGRPLVREDVERAATIANAAGFIEALPNGYDTVVGERATRLSGGERQRLAIARAIYGRPDVLILDEATAALDTASERVVQAAIEKALEGTTAVVIAHRLSTIVGADLVVVLDRGAVLATGRHDSLLESCPLYRQLWDAQFQAGEPDAAASDGAPTR
jgi:subfamily B ATP-binding cassette protein MsbA